MTKDKSKWRIESRQRIVFEPPAMQKFIGNTPLDAGHNYLVLVDSAGTVIEELHGWKNNGWLRAVRRLPNKGLINHSITERKGGKVKFGSFLGKEIKIDNAEVGTEESPSQATLKDVDTAIVVKSGNLQNVGAIWLKMLREAEKLDASKNFYDPINRNSNSFWGTVLKATGFDPAKHDLHPRSNRTVPAWRIDLRIPSPDFFELNERERFVVGGLPSQTRLAEEDGLPVPTDLAQLAIATTRRRRRRRRRRQGQLG